MGGFDFNWAYLFAPSTVVFFMLGHLIARAATRWPRIADRRLGFALLAFCFLALALTRPTVAFDTLRFWFAVLAFTVALPGVFAATKNSAILNAMGALSYPLYLTHELTRGIMHEKLAAIVVANPIGSLAAFCAACLAAAIIAHFLLERPFAALMRAASASFSRPVRSPAE